MSKISEKLKDVLKPEDLAQVETAISELISEAVEMKEEELKKHYDKVSKEFIDTEMATKETEIRNLVNEEYSTKLETLEEQYVEKIDSFIDSEISEKISEETLQKYAINEAYKPIVEGVLSVLQENYVKFDSEGGVLLSESTARIAQLEKDNNKLIEEKLELSSIAEKAAIKLLLEEKTEGLNEEQTARVYEIFEGKTFDEIETKVVGYVDLIVEEESKVSNEKGKDEVIEEQNVEDLDGTESKTKNPDLLEVADSWM